MKKGLKFHPLALAIVIIVGAYIVFAFAIPPFIPLSLLSQYMIIVVVGILLIFSYNNEEWQQFKLPLKALLMKKHLFPLRMAILLFVSVGIAYISFRQFHPIIQPPIETRQVHPAPPAMIKAYGKQIALKSLSNPVREQIIANRADKQGDGLAIYKQSVRRGEQIYFKNCFFCHGAMLMGEGIFASGLNPRPINFQDVGTIAQMEESYLFWRIVKGGKGLPVEGAPWNSSMPAWEDILAEEQVWDVINYLFDYTGQVPRIWDSNSSRIATSIRDELMQQRQAMDGKAIYELHCLACHGELGRGDGVAADLMYPKPRDFSFGVFKYKSTTIGMPASDKDIFNSIKFGLPGTAMPAWGKLLNDKQIMSLVGVIKGFDTSMAFAPEDAEDEDFNEEGLYLKSDFLSYHDLEPLEKREVYSSESIAKGKLAYQQACEECHGKLGRGDITSGKRLEDDWGELIWPRDLTKPWTWRLYDTTEDVEKKKQHFIEQLYTRISLGIPGTPMPAHRAGGEGNEDPVSQADRWHIANYLYSAMEKGDTRQSKFIRAKKVSTELPTDFSSHLWDDVSPVSFPLIPNIIHEPRLYTALNDTINIKALYNQEQIAFLLTINDRTRSIPGDEYFSVFSDENQIRHSDAVAIQFQKSKSDIGSGFWQKASFMHGERQRTTQIWYWNAGSLNPQLLQYGKVFHAKGMKLGLAEINPAITLQTKAKWEHGQWSVLIMAKRLGKENMPLFRENQFIPISFANWDGNNNEFASKHTFTSWGWLILAEQTNRNLAILYAALIGLISFIAGYIVLLRICKANPHS